MKDHETDWSETISFSDIPGMDRRRVNGSLRAVSNDTCIALIGMPRGTFSTVCQDPTEPGFLAMVETADFGPFRATGIRPAVIALRGVMAEISAEEPAIHDQLRTAGMMCCRLVRGSRSSISNHAWGIAIDLKIGPHLDGHGDGRVQRGLLRIAPIFQRHKFYWGAAFPKEDAMHFEASDQLVREWAAAGQLQGVKMPAIGALTFGSRSPEVRDMQVMLNRLLGLAIEEDGIFGRDTRAAVVAFQIAYGLEPSGNAGPTVMARLRKLVG